MNETNYLITVEGRLGTDWTAWFDCLEATFDEGTSRTCLWVLKDDPILLYGVLPKSAH